MHDQSIAAINLRNVEPQFDEEKGSAKEYPLEGRERGVHVHRTVNIAEI